MTSPCALLDLDGTLIDSRPGIIASIGAALRALGHTPDPAFDLGFALGPPLPEAMATILAHYQDTRVDQAVAAYRAHYGTTGLFDSTVYDGMAATLTALHTAGWRLHLATSKRVDFARRILAHFDLARLFEGIHGTEPDGEGEQKPELIARILQRGAIAAADVVMVGDRRFDIAGAHANGVRAVGVLWGYGSRAELEAAGADGLVETPGGLLGWLVG